jgi:hypothetical protein
VRGVAAREVDVPQPAAPRQRLAAHERPPLPDTSLWIEAYGLDALCAVAVRHRAAAAPRWIDQLEAITARRGIRELLLRATVYRARLGEPGALDAARLLAGQIDNPALDQLELEQLV